MARSYEVHLNIDDPQNAVWFQRTGVSPTNQYFPNTIYGEASFDLTVYFWHGAVTGDGTPVAGTTAANFQSGDGLTLYGRIEDSPGGIAPITLATGSFTQGQNSVLFDVNAGLIPDDWSRVDLDTTSKYPVAIWFNGTHEGDELTAKTNVIVIDKDHVGTGDAFTVPDASGLVYDPTNPADWVVVPTTMQGGLDELADRVTTIETYTPADGADWNDPDPTTLDGGLDQLADRVATIETSPSGDMLASTYDPTNIASDVYDRANHTGTQLASTISDFDTNLAGTANVTVFTPSADYHPATKKYVDDNSGGGGGGIGAYQQISTGQLLAVNTGYMYDASSAVTHTLPASPAQGDIVKLTHTEVGSEIITIDGNGNNILQHPNPSDTTIELNIVGAHIELTFNGTDWFISDFSGTGGDVITEVTTIGAVAIIEDQKASGTSGGTFTSGAWYTRDLNTILSDDDSIVSLSVNQFTLQEGKYRIEASAPAYKVNGHQAKLYNVTDSTDELIGSNEYTSSSYNVGNRSFVGGIVTIASAKTFEIQHQCITTVSTNGLGLYLGYGTEVYTQLTITKLG